MNKKSIIEEISSIKETAADEGITTDKINSVLEILEKHGIVHYKDTCGDCKWIYNPHKGISGADATKPFRCANPRVDVDAVFVRLIDPNSTACVRFKLKD